MSPLLAALAGWLRQVLLRPRNVVELAGLGALTSAAVVIVTTSGAALYLSSAGSAGLPALYIGLACVSVPIAWLLSTLLARWRPTRVCRGIGFTAALALVAAGLMPDIAGLPFAVFLAAYLLEILYDTMFWIIVGEFLTTREQKRHMPFLAMAFGLGGVLGGAVAYVCALFVSPAGLLLVAAVILAVSMAQLARIETNLPLLGDGEQEEVAEGSALHALRTVVAALRRFPIIVLIGLSVLSMSALFCVQDYLAMGIYASQFPDAAELTSFLSVVFAAQQLLELQLLAVATPLLLNRAGPLLRNLAFPATSLVGLLLLLIGSTLPAALLLHANANAVSNALFEPVKGLNYAAIPTRIAAQLRIIVEGVAYPLGIALAGLALLSLQTPDEAAGARVWLAAFAVLALFTISAAGVGLLFLPSLIRCLRLRGGFQSAGDRPALPDLEALRGHGDPDVRLLGEALLQRFAASDQTDNANAVPRAEWVDDALAFSQDEDAEIRIAAAGLLGAEAPRCSAVTAALRRLLEDPIPAVRYTAAPALACHGNAAVRAVEDLLSSPRPEVVSGAIRVLGLVKSRRARRVLRAYLRPLYRAARANQAQMRALGARSGDMVSLYDFPANAGLMAASLAEKNRDIIWRVLTVKAALGSRREVNLLYSLAQSHDARLRSNALEALANLPTGRLIRPLLGLLEAADGVGLPRLLIPDWTARLLPQIPSGEWPCPTSHRDGRAAEHQTVAEQADLVLVLKSVPELAALAYADLSALVQQVSSRATMAGEIVAAKDAVRHLIVVQSGALALEWNGHVVAEVGPGGVVGSRFGSAAAASAATLRAIGSTHMLLIPQTALADLAAEHPHILTAALLAAEQRLEHAYAALAAMAGKSGLQSVPARMHPEES